MPRDIDRAPRRRARRAIGAGLVLAVAACSDSAQITLPSGTVCVPYSFSPGTVTGQKGVPVGCAISQLSLPSWLSFSSPPPLVSGTPTGNDYGNFLVSATGICPGRVWGTNNWTITGLITIAAPAAPTAAPPLLINTASGPSVTSTVTGPACATTYNVGTPTLTAGTNQPTLTPSGSVATTGGTFSETLSVINDLNGIGNFSVAIPPNGATTSPVSGTIPFTIQFP
jgi:hypothetical protein